MTMVKGDYPLPNHDDKAFNKVTTVELLLHDYRDVTMTQMFFYKIQNIYFI